MSIENRIFKHDKYWELISGPWEDFEKLLMDHHIEGFNRSGIDCIIEHYEGKQWVYRDSKGYINQRSNKIYLYDKKGKPFVVSAFRKIQREIQREMMLKANL